MSRNYAKLVSQLNPEGVTETFFLGKDHDKNQPKFKSKSIPKKDLKQLLKKQNETPKDDVIIITDENAHTIIEKVDPIITDLQEAKEMINKINTDEEE